MQYLLFFIHAVVACYLISRSSLISKTGLHVKYWLAFFSVKIIAGCVYGYWYSRPGRVATADTWRFHNDALEEYKLLFSHPLEYFSNLFQNGYNTWTGVLSSHGYWNNLKDNLMLKIISLMDIFSGGHYYVNVVIYSFITLFGFVFIYLACKNVLHKSPGMLTTIIIFLCPSCLFWTSGIHRDGMVLLFTGLCLWYCTKFLSEPVSTRLFVIPLISLAGMFAFRNYLVILLMPAMAAYFITNKFKLRPVIIYPLTAGISILLFFSSSLIVPEINLPKALIDRKIAFEQLDGKSRLPQINLSPTLKSFSSNLPQAMNHSFLRPYFWEIKNAEEALAVLEIILLYLIIFLSLIYRRKTIHEDSKGFQRLIAFFCLSVFLLIGYTIPFAGAVVRYRAIFLMLITSVLSFNIPPTHYIIENIWNIFTSLVKSGVRRNNKMS